MLQTESKISRISRPGLSGVRNPQTRISWQTLSSKNPILAHTLTVTVSVDVDVDVAIAIEGKNI